MPDDERYLVICGNGHVTDANADYDTRTGEPVTAQAARDMARGGWRDRGMTEPASVAWRTQCRQMFKQAGGSWHQCRGLCTSLDQHPALASAYALGGQAAVVAVLMETRGRWPLP